MRERPVGGGAGPGREGAAGASLPDPVAPDRPTRQRRSLPVYDVATGEDLETPVNLDNTLLQVMFPDPSTSLYTGSAPYQHE